MTELLQQSIAQAESFGFDENFIIELTELKRALINWQKAKSFDL